MDPFKNAATSVTKHSYGVMNESAFRKEASYKTTALENLSYAEKEKRMDKVFENRAKEISLEEFATNSTEGKIYNKRLMNKMQEIARESKEAIFTNILYSLYEASLVLDASFIIEKRAQLESFVVDYVKSNGGYSLLENAVAENPGTPILSKIKDICESVTNKIVDEKYQFTKENSTPIDDVCLTISDDAKEEINAGKSELDIDALSAAVKDKVLTVIKDEKERQAKNIEREEELDKAGEEVRAQYEQLRIIKTGQVKESTSLFFAIMQNTYMDLIRENVITQEAANGMIRPYDNPNSDEEDPSIGVTLNKLNDDESVENINAKNTQEYINTNDIDEDEEYDDEDEEDEVKSDSLIGMDLVLAESVAKYTLLEIVSTIRLENFTKEMYESMVFSLLK